MIEPRMPPPTIPLPESTTLPKSVRLRLMDAAAIEPDVPLGESPTRTRELESVIFHARAHHPRQFRGKL